MNDILSEEQQQIESIKNWISEHLLSLIAAIAVFCAIVFGPDFYQSYKNSKIFPASDAYEQFALAVTQAASGSVATESELELVDQIADLLIEQHGDSHYAFLASLGAAKLSVDLGNYQAALSRLQWAEQNTGNEADQLLVNHRLALVEAQLGDTESALQRLSSSNSHFAPLYAETRGDIYSSLGQREQAIAAYEESLAALNGEVGNFRSVELKLNNLKTGLGSVVESTASSEVEATAETDPEGTIGSEETDVENVVSEESVSEEASSEE